MAAIAPFRYLIVYPALMRTIERQWRSRTTEVSMPAGATALKLLDRVDYQDAYALETRVRLTPEEWMRVFLEGSPSALRGFVGGVFRILRFGKKKKAADGRFCRTAPRSSSSAPNSGSA